MKPISMSTASAMPPLLPASISGLHHRPGQHELEEAVDRREAGEVDGARPRRPCLDRQQQGREDDDRRQELRAAEASGGSSARRARRAHTRRFEPVAQASTASCSALRALLFEVVAGLLDEDVVERGVDQLERVDLDAGLVERPHDRRDLGGAALDLDAGRLPSAGRQQLAEPGADLARPARSQPSPRSQPDVRGGRPRPSATSGVPSATILPSSMIPTRSASWSASSRYWVVRKTVVPSSLQRAHLLPDRLAADRVEAGGRLVEEEHARLVDERHREVEAAPHAARVGADAAVRGVGEVDALEQLVGARALPPRVGIPWSVACSRDQLARRSSAGRAPPPAAPRRSSAAPRAASRDHVVAGDRRAARRSAQQRGEHPHRRRLAGAVGPEEAVDLALGRPRGRRPAPPAPRRRRAPIPRRLSPASYARGGCRIVRVGNPTDGGLA